jgi:alanyl-tRNA synthetase
MTDRLYYSDSMLRTFTARIIQRRDTERGPAVRLDRTAFYPTSGGQPNDTGMLDDDVRVVDVWDDDAGEVWHLLDRRTERDEVHGTIDWARRFDHMQQHSGQHLLSAAFVRIRDAPTVSFHLGADDSSIDLDLPQLTWDDAFRVEAEVNRVIAENRPLDVHMVHESEIHRIPLRRPPKVSGEIRVIWIRDYDAVACGGTHVPQSGAVGLLKITRVERYKGGTRVGFVCGGRALAHYQRTLSALQTASADLSVHPDELPEAVVRLKSDLKDARHELTAARGALVTIEAERLWAEAAEVGGTRRVVAYLDDCSFDDACKAASQLSAKSRTVALLAAGDAKGVRVVCARSADLSDVNAAEILKHALDALGGRGGGTAEHARGGAPVASRDVVVEALRQAVGGRKGLRG